MHFYRPLRPLAALTFDLDDTLYDNRPVIKQTELQSVAFLQNYHPGLNHFQSADFHRLRQELREQDPEIYHDVTQWRWRAIHLALSRQGLRDAQAAEGADAAMQNFALWRSRIEVPEATHATLKALGERFPTGGDHQRQCRSCNVRAGRLLSVCAAVRAGWPRQTLSGHVSTGRRAFRHRP
jgi:FMN hydrolase / 5-amino-6-(5-phospho-D-ribitylamino)uracil phosphatase